MTVFSEKLNGLADTVRLASGAATEPLARALRAGAGRGVVAVGSGGSAVAAEYLARCRSTLGYRRTLVRTPMELVLDLDDLDGCEVWLFSAGAANPDISASLRAALASRAEVVRLVTTRADGAVAVEAAANRRCDIHVLPVADPRDGFIATHSMIATVAALLLASADGSGRVDQARRLEAAVEAIAGPTGRAEAARAMSSLAPDDALLVLDDPQLRSIGTLLETSLWETAICPVQRTDVRNFAHGRHVWPARRPSRTFLLALCTAETRAAWAALDRHLPPEVRRREEAFGLGGRYDVATGIVRALALIDGMGVACGVDPGRPGHGPFAKAMYDDAALDRLAIDLTPSTRHKLAAVLAADRDVNAGTPSEIGRERLDRLARTAFHGVVVDYDGTVVATKERLAPPCAAIASEIVRLVDGGVRVGVATGRGGSAGEMLREALPLRVHPQVTMGYYNGAHLRPLDVDVSAEPPPQDASIRAVGDWLGGSGLLKAGGAARVGRLQVTVDHSDLVDPRSFPLALGACPWVTGGSVRVLSSQHSYDVVGRTASKSRVVEAVAEKAGGAALPILAIGDSGSEGGNDHELLTRHVGVSVDRVCGALDGCWSVFGTRARGPQALLRILRALGTGGDGTVRLDVAGLGLDP